ncbi:hypothetical protein T484DRAFT_1880416, partial [Baffinella frigidus]
SFSGLSGTLLRPPSTGTLHPGHPGYPGGAGGDRKDSGQEIFGDGQEIFGDGQEIFGEEAGRVGADARGGREVRHTRALDPLWGGKGGGGNPPAHFSRGGGGGGGGGGGERGTPKKSNWDEARSGGGGGVGGGGEFKEVLWGFEELVRREYVR